jgi:hypothetical protein
MNKCRDFVRFGIEREMSGIDLISDVLPFRSVVVI